MAATVSTLATGLVLATGDGTQGYHPYAPVLALILVMIAMGGGILAFSHLVGPRRHGPGKDATYEAGMATIGDARRRFNVQFYVVAMLFLLFDVEVVLLWPWALAFYDAAVHGQALTGPAGEVFGPSLIVASIGFFVALLVVGFIYEMGKGVFRWT